MSRTTRTPTDVMVTPLDLSAVEAEAAAYLTKHREVDGKSAVTKVTTNHTWGVVETPQGLFALCSEGVGPDDPITDEKPLRVEMWVRAYADKGEDTFISIFPEVASKLGPEELRGYATDERVNLADFIRTFGARLDGNYSMWRSTLEQAVAA